MLDQVLIQIRLDSDDLSAYTLEELARPLVLILEIVLAFLFIGAEVLLAAGRLAHAMAAMPERAVQGVATAIVRILLDGARCAAAPERMAQGAAVASVRILLEGARFYFAG